MFLYIDATAGGLIIQVLLGGFASIGFIGRLFWGRFGGRSSESSDDSEASASASIEPDEMDRAA